MSKKYDLEIGIDLHNNFSQVAVVDTEGRTVSCARFPNSPDVLGNFFDSLHGSYRVTFESTRNYFWLADFLNEKDVPFIMSNPFLNRAIANIHAKNDKYDAVILANLTRSNMIASCFVPSKPIRDLRELVRCRMSIMHQQTVFKNRIHALLAKYNFSGPYQYIFGPNGREWLQAQKFSPLVKELIEDSLDSIDYLRSKADKLYEKIKRRVIKHPWYKILTSVPGIGLIHAATLIAEIADISRFPKVESFVRYAGLSVNTFASADKIHYGHINKQSNYYIRTALVEASQILVRKDPGLSTFYRYLKGLKGHGIATVAVARKLSRSIYFMLKNQTEYKYRKINMAWVKPNARITAIHTNRIAGCNVY